MVTTKMVLAPVRCKCNKLPVVTDRAAVVDRILFGVHVVFRIVVFSTFAVRCWFSLQDCLLGNIISTAYLLNIYNLSLSVIVGHAYTFSRVIVRITVRVRTVCAWPYRLYHFVFFSLLWPTLYRRFVAFFELLAPETFVIAEKTFQKSLNGWKFQMEGVNQWLDIININAINKLVDTLQSTL